MKILEKTATLLEPLHPYVSKVLQELDDISSDRKVWLAELAEIILRQVQFGKESKLTFICTHNSRRSHMSQIWAQTAAACFGIPNIETFSGGTEATACNIRTVRALRRAGFSVTDASLSAVSKLTSKPAADNPVYLIEYSEHFPPLKCFSKVYSADGNPEKDFTAVMTCTEADRNCPVVFGCANRISLPYLDPKISDDTEDEEKTYDARLRQIAREMFYVMRLVGQSLVERE